MFLYDSPHFLTQTQLSHGLYKAPWEKRREFFFPLPTTPLPPTKSHTEPHSFLKSPHIPNKSLFLAPDPKELVLFQVFITSFFLSETLRYLLPFQYGFIYNPELAHLVMELETSLFWPFPFSSEQTNIVSL
jgi:hypothetical protein